MNPIKNFSYFIHYAGKNINRIPPSKIDFYHLTFVLEGKFVYNVEGKEIILEKNDAMILIPHTIRERVFNPEQVEFVLFNYTPTLGNELKSNLILRNVITPKIRKMLEAYPYNWHLTPSLIEITSQENEKNKTVLQNILNCILIEILDFQKYETDNVHVIDALKYINDNLLSPITLNDVSKEIHLSKEHIARLFKKEINSTVSEYINSQKLILAKNMLLSNQIPLKEVASKLGFENYCYFSKIFKKQFGISPIKVKNQISAK